MYDKAHVVPVFPLLYRAPDDEAFCAVCAGGLSAEPNAIVFCERCDVAVHQACYSIYPLPEGAAD